MVKMRKVSKKREKQNKEYKKVRDEFMEDHPFCEAKVNGCFGRSTEVHHKNDRNGDRLLDVAYFMAVCRNCHNWIHEHPKESREKEWLL